MALELSLSHYEKGVVSEKETYQADIFRVDRGIPIFDYHARGDTPYEAMIRLALFWAEKDGIDKEDLLKSATK